MESWLAASHPTVFLLLTPCLENPIMERGRARLEGWAGSTSVWRERGGPALAPAQRTGPVGRVQAAQTGPWVWGRCDTQLNRHRPQCQMTHSDMLLAKRALQERTCKPEWTVESYSGSFLPLNCYRRHRAGSSSTAHSAVYFLIIPFLDYYLTYAR